MRFLWPSKRYFRCAGCRRRFLRRLACRRCGRCYSCCRCKGGFRK